MIFIPEIFLFTVVLLSMLVGPFLKKNDYKIIGYLSLMSIIIAQFLVFRDIFHFEEIFNNFFVVDSFGSFMKSLLLIGSGIIIYIFLINEKNQTLNKIEFPILIVISLIGMMLMVSANDLLSLFLSIELQSLLIYFFVAFDIKILFS